MARPFDVWSTQSFIKAASPAGRARRSPIKKGSHAATSCGYLSVIPRNQGTRNLSRMRDCLEQVQRSLATLGMTDALSRSFGRFRFSVPWGDQGEDCFWTRMKSCYALFSSDHIGAIPPKHNTNLIPLSALFILYLIPPPRRSSFDFAQDHHPR